MFADMTQMDDALHALKVFISQTPQNFQITFTVRLRLFERRKPSEIIYRSSIISRISPPMCGLASNPSPLLPQRSANCTGTTPTSPMKTRHERERRRRRPAPPVSRFPRRLRATGGRWTLVPSRPRSDFFFSCLLVSFWRD